jgi:hypothetical protein
MAEQADGVDGVLVAVAGGKLEDGKIHFDLRFTIYDLRVERLSARQS